MSAQYIVRFDDVCPTMDWQIWARLEPTLLRHDIKPILAVVPDNRDPTLVVSPSRADFWDLVRHWQRIGWTIALHGNQHVYETKDAGLLGVNPYSEFAGLPAEVQRKKLEDGLNVFRREGVRVQAWVAPAHSFDRTTVGLLIEFGIRVISDGFYVRPVSRFGAVWVPQQLWRFRHAPCGVWTVCFHANTFDEAAIARFEADVGRFASRITDLPTAVEQFGAGAVRWSDHAMAGVWRTALRARRLQASPAG